jgi:predicted ribosome quality control (RQC) complex YloA/Tae2 family protein
MDGSLIEMFCSSVQGRVVGQVIGPVRWLSPVLSLPVGGRGRGEHMVAILANPGPFCYLADQDPLQGTPAPARFPQMAGAVVTGVTRLANQRILRLEVETAGEMTETLRLDLLLFGSAGRAELARRDGGVLQAVGGRLSAKSEGAASVEFTEAEFYLISAGRLGRVAPSSVDVPEAAHRLGPFRNAVEACRQAGAQILEEAHRLMIRHRSRPLTRRLSAQRQLLVKLKGDLDLAANHDGVGREAETLAAYQSQIKQGAKKIELPDAYDPQSMVTIGLDPALPIRVQIEKRFKRAAKLLRSESHLRRRIGEVRQNVDVLDTALTDIDSTDNFASAMDELNRQLAGLSGGRRAAPVPGGKSTQPVAVGRRKFELDEVWFVLVGRSNRENDDLTFHEASPTDLWFHAQHVPGSHVILKSRGNPGAPPVEILERAASVAAHFSKSRHSSLVPVIYTQRKYVRKPRGAKPGQVVCEREKMVMVAPELPAEIP